MGMGAGLLAGAALARSGRIRVHAAWQSAIVLLNLALIVLTMFPVFHRQVLPKLPGRIGKPYYALAATHAALGGVAELAGLYILLAGGTRLLSWKFRNRADQILVRSVLVNLWVGLFLCNAPFS